MGLDKKRMHEKKLVQMEKTSKQKFIKSFRYIRKIDTTTCGGNFVEGVII